MSMTTRRVAIIQCEFTGNDGRECTESASFASAANYEGTGAFQMKAIAHFEAMGWHVGGPDGIGARCSSHKRKPIKATKMKR